jgi:hypothetical protein
VGEGAGVGAAAGAEMSWLSVDGEIYLSYTIRV